MNGIVRLIDYENESKFHDNITCTMATFDSPCYPKELRHINDTYHGECYRLIFDHPGGGYDGWYLCQHNCWRNVITRVVFENGEEIILHGNRDEEVFDFFTRYLENNCELPGREVYPSFNEDLDI